MLNHDLLINKGFKLNQYPQGKFYELTIENPDCKLLDTLEYNYDPSMMPEQIIIQTEEDFSNIVILIDGDDWDLPLEEFKDVLKVL